MPTPDFQVSTSDGVIAISGRLDFTTASQALHAVNEQMLAAASVSSVADNNNAQQPESVATDPVVIDLGSVTHSNSAGLALMIEWLAEAQRAGRTIRFENIPNSLRQISTVCHPDAMCCAVRDSAVLVDVFRPYFNHSQRSSWTNY